MLNLAFPSAGRWLVAAALVAPLAAIAQTTPAANANTSTTISTNTSATLPSAGSVLSGTTRAVGGAARTVGGAAGGAATAAYHAAAPEQRAARMSQKLKQELSLDAATTAKVQAAALARAQKIDAIQTGSATNKEKNTALQSNAQEFKTALQGILTPAQYTQYLSKAAKAKVAVQASGSADME